MKKSPISNISIFSKLLNGFTMAEVLITLGIIGIIAALTIPQVISKYKKSVVQTELQKAFTVLNQAILRSEVDNESAAYWEWTTVSGANETNKFFDKYFKPYMNTSGTIPGGLSGFKTFSGAGENVSWQYANNNNAKFVKLSDGTIVKLSLAAGGRGGELGGWTVILPHSANKKRLIMGRDAFRFSINLNNNKTSISVFPNSYRGWNCQKVQENRADFISKCYALGGNTTGNYPDSYCTILIYCNNWEIPDDYPIKF